MGTEQMRAIAYSLDTLLPGFYLWLGPIALRIGGSAPDDSPYRYPSTIHSPVGMALVLFGRAFTTYRGMLDAQEGVVLGGDPEI